jgi:hypothetical protein
MITSAPFFRREAFFLRGANTPTPRRHKGSLSQRTPTRAGPLGSSRRHVDVEERPTPFGPEASRHITQRRAAGGSDQAASLAALGFQF